jgi:membrane dipeptidase
LHHLIDGAVTTLQKSLAKMEDQVIIGERYNDGQVDLPRLREGGVDAFFLSLFVAEEYYPGRFETKQTLRLLEAAREQIERNHDAIEVALTAADIERINR